MTEQRIRAGVVRIIDRGDSTTVIGPKLARTFAGDSAGLLRAVLEIHGRPVTREQLFGELAERSGGVVPAQPVDDLLAMLVAEGVLVAPRAPAIAAPAMPRRVVLAITG